MLPIHKFSMALLNKTRVKHDGVGTRYFTITMCISHAGYRAVGRRLSSCFNACLAFLWETRTATLDAIPDTISSNINSGFD